MSTTATIDNESFVEKNIPRQQVLTNDSDINLSGPATIVDVEVKNSVSPSKIGSDDFLKLLTVELSAVSIWRSGSALANKLKVDQKELETWLDRRCDIVRGNGTKDGVYYYGMKARMEDKPKEKTITKVEPSITAAERFALAKLDLLSNTLESVLEKYALRISQRDEEAYSQLTKSLKHLQAAVALLGKSTKANPADL